MKIKKIWELPPYDHIYWETKKMDNKNVMLPSEFADMIRRATHNDEVQWDEEDVHRAMDSIMCELLISLGYEEGVEIFRNTPKWYA